MSGTMTPRLLAATPHRLLFFIGASNVLLAMLWWAAWLVAGRWQLWPMPQPSPYAGWLHAFVMQYQMLPSFIFGFLLTVFPRWMGLPDLERWRYAPVGIGLFGGQLATLLGAMGWLAGVVVGAWMTLAGWLAGIAHLLPMLWRERGTTWHARSCMAALLLGLLGLIAWLGFLLAEQPLLAFASIKLGTFGLLLPIYLTVAHRMFPFFAGNVVPGYTPWRPMWLLAAIWPLLLAHLLLELVHAYGWLWLVDVPLFALALLMNWKTWPRTRAPVLLTALFMGLAWLPVTFALYAGQSIVYALTGVFELGRVFRRDASVPGTRTYARMASPLSAKEADTARTESTNCSPSTTAQAALSPMAATMTRSPSSALPDDRAENPAAVEDDAKKEGIAIKIKR